MKHQTIDQMTGSGIVSDHASTTSWPTPAPEDTTDHPELDTGGQDGPAC